MVHADEEFKVLLNGFELAGWQVNANISLTASVNTRGIHTITVETGGDFVVEKNFGAKAGVAGGNFFILAKDQLSALKAAEDAVAAIGTVEGTITPFTGGVVASGSKPSSNKYKFMHATVNEKYCPTLKDKIEDSDLPAEVNAVFEIVIDGVSEEAVKDAMKVGIKAAVKVPSVVKITAGNFGGNLGKYQFKLKDVLGL